VGCGERQNLERRAGGKEEIKQEERVKAQKGKGGNQEEKSPSE